MLDQMNLQVRFMALSGPFKTVKTATYPSTKEATAAIEAYAAESGFTCVKAVDDGDDFSIRWTAKTPGGRSGRNIAFGDWGDSG